MQTSGLILDVYDDFRGEVIRSLFPTRSEIPGLVKAAHALSSAERGLLPDDAFALVLLNGEERLRKFACIDAGNTALSVLYFLKNAHKLPEEAVKVAAANLQVACDWYDLPVEGLEKVALVGFAASQVVKHPWTALNMAMMGPDIARDVRANNHAVSQMRAERGETLGGMPISPEQIQEHRSKHASMSPYVDVTDKTAPARSSAKVASVYALAGKYPLDSYEQVKEAGAYFAEFGMRLSPEQRRDFCTSFIKRAEALNLPVSEHVRHYGGDAFGTPDMLKTAHDLRAFVLTDETHRAMLDGLFEKAAELGPELFCETLGEFDKLAGLHYLYDKDIPDPYFSTFYKQAEEDFSWLDGNEMLTEEDLRRFAKVSTKAMSDRFGEDFAVEFRKDPVGIFKSLPTDQKKIVARMANENSPGVGLMT